MPTNSLLIGPLQVLTEDIIYALPTRACYILSDVPLEVSNETAFTTIQPVAATTTALVVGGFVRSTTADANIHIKAI